MTAGGCQDTGCQAQRWDASLKAAEADRDRLREALTQLVADVAGPVGRMGLRDPDPDERRDWEIMRAALKQARTVLDQTSASDKNEGRS